MSIKPLVSIVIPAYNHEKYIKETIKSLINQTYENLELIVIDDGSTDSTFEKLQELKQECEERFVRVVFQKKENEGTCKTYNQFLNICNGKYIYDIASDDVSAHSAIEKEVDFLENNNEFVICVGNNEFIDINSKKCNVNLKFQPTISGQIENFKDYYEIVNPDIKFNSEDFGTYKTLIFRNYIPNGVLIKKSIFEKIGKYPEEAPLEDYWLLLQASKYGKIKFLDDILYYYRLHSSNSINNKTRLNELTVKTKEYELELINHANLNEMLPEISEYMKKGYFYKKISRYIFFKLEYFQRLNNIIIIYKFIGLPVFKRMKNGDDLYYKN